MDRLFNYFKPRQYKIPPLYCTGSNNCWCSKLETKLEHKPGYDFCLTPKQVLEQHIDKLSKDDIIYLNSIANRSCIW